VAVQVLALHPRFVVVMQRAVAIANGTDEQETEAAVLDDDEDTAKGLARLFAELGEAYTPLIVRGKPLTILCEGLLTWQGNCKVQRKSTSRDYHCVLI
jgi:hypothetical protein